MADDEYPELSKFRNSLQHSYAAYRFFLSSLPHSDQFRHDSAIRVGKFEFRSLANKTSMEVELGWAFFSRLYANFEAFLLRVAPKPKKPKEAIAWLSKSGLLTEDDIRGVEVARELRNTFLHGDGDTTLLHHAPEFVQTTNGQEPHVYPEPLVSGYK